jgi:hypothetical protein
MRWIFLLLVALNIFYFVWTQQQRPSLSRDVAPFTLPDGAKRNIHLVSERKSLEGEQGSVVSSGELCLHLGGFENGNDASLLEQRLISLDIPAKQTVVSSESSKDYWVYLPPFGSRDAALRQFRELQARGLDSYLITQGDLTNGVSLGIFSGQDSAVSLLERIRAMGYGAEMRELIRERRDYWVYVPPQGLGLIGDTLLGQLAQDFPGLRQQMLPCAASLARS